MVMMAGRRGLAAGLVATRAAGLIAPLAATVAPRIPCSAMSTIGAGATPGIASGATATKVAGDPATVAGVLWLHKLSHAHRETRLMAEELQRAQSAHNLAVAESKRAVGVNGPRMLVIGTSLLVTLLSLGRE